MAPVNSDECMARPTNLVRDVNADGESRIQVGNNYTEVHNYNEPNRNRCIADLRLTDPRDDKARIEQTKGGLLKDSYKWVLDHEDFRRWRDDRDSRLLWIKGDAGKGKTMLLCGIIDELSQSRAEITNALASMLCDAKGCYMVVDALDECEMGLPQLLCFIVQTASAYAHVKWIVSSRNRPDIEQELCFDDPRTRLSLELNAQHVTQAINIFIDYKISKLVSLKGDKSLQDKVRHEMQRKAGGTFLWAALVAQELRSIQPWDMLGLLEQRPSGLLPLYHRMMEQIEKLQPEYRGLCRLVLSTAAIVYQPLLLCALGLMSGLPAQIARDSSPIDDLHDDGTVYKFLSKKYLYWLEALSLLRAMPEGVEEYDKSRLFDLVRDARRFILSHGWAIGNAPLQAYASALIFSPRQSITRKLFEGEEPNWV
ncbi:hypothetical protein FOXB_09997, partial [Fusarium oxysporum f. sp. conglutinans Fo5176]